MTLGFFLESLHLIEFALLYVLIVLALQVHDRFSKTTNILAAIFASFYGLTDEFHQLFVDGRSFTINDLIKDWCGVWTAYFIVNLISLRRNNHSHRNSEDDVDTVRASLNQ
ncbi:VanZ family protein [Halobacillus sp. HZG1]|uniref:VanZ family protein n=1 Tax=Halobacillus sp. HZG1 TaxID=3111769 RepID=UPI002DB9C040|nr:VanZ family protein [Halobacillus sp. HZG1]MEC3883965.1 VanZ family protein [Halobacillus sp. HZG1]